MNGANTYDGGTTLAGSSQGTLTAGSTNAFGTGPLAANVGTVNLNGFTVSIGQLSGSSGAIITSNTSTPSSLTTNAAGNSTYAGRITDGSGVVGFTKAGGGTLTLSGSNAFSGGTTVSAGTLLAGNAQAFGTGTVTVSGGTLDLGSLGVTNALQLQSGGLANAAAYAGTQTVSGTFAYSAGSIGGTVNAVSGGVLQGGGTFTGGVTIGAGAIHAPGNSPGSQTFAAGLSYADSSTLQWELISNTESGPGTNYDSIAVTGGSLSIAEGAALQLLFSGSGSAVNWNNSFWNSNHTWTVIGVGEELTSSGIFSLLGDGSTWLDSNSLSLAAAMAPNGRTVSTFFLDNSTGSILLNYTVVAVPEPSTLVLLGLGVAGLAASRTSRRRR